MAAHLHMNWAFTAPGTYPPGLAADGRLKSNGQLVTSEAADYTFEARPIEPRLAIPLVSGRPKITFVAEPGWKGRLVFADRLPGPAEKIGEPLSGSGDHETAASPLKPPAFFNYALWNNHEPCRAPAFAAASRAIRKPVTLPTPDAESFLEPR